MSVDDLGRLRDRYGELGDVFRSADADAPGPRAKAALFAALGIASVTATTTAGATSAGAAATKATASVTAAKATASVTAAKASASLIVTKWVVTKWVVATAVVVGGATATTYAVTTTSAPSSPPTDAAQRAPLAERSAPSPAPASMVAGEPAAPTDEPVARADEPAPSARASLSPASTGGTSPSRTTDQPSTEAEPAPAPDAVPTAAPATSIADEIAALERARRELAGGRASTALASLRGYRARFPRGVLEEEASVLEIEALTRVGQVDRARQLGAAFLRSRPSSPLAPRVRRAVDRP